MIFFELLLRTYAHVLPAFEFLAKPLEGGITLAILGVNVGLPLAVQELVDESSKYSRPPDFTDLIV